MIKKYRDYFTINEKEKILKLKLLSVRQASYWCKIYQDRIYKLIRNRGATGFPLAPQIFLKRNYKIPAQELIDWINGLHNETLPKAQLNAVKKLFK